MPSASTMDVVERFSDGLRGYTSGRMLSITGPYGSGKSTMAMFLNGLVSGKGSEEWDAAYDILRTESPVIAKEFKVRRKKLDIHERGLIRCVVTARREPITATILRALDAGALKFFTKYSKKDFARAGDLRQGIRNLKQNKLPSSEAVIDIVKSMCSVAPVIIMIDEFGKNIEHFATDEAQQSDLFLLQELAEMSGKNRKIPLSIVTLQHMAFDEYAAGASATQKREWAKIQGRFEDIPFENSPDQTRLLISNTIIRTKGSHHFQDLARWARKEAKTMQALGLDSGFDYNMIHSCYPLSPIALEILPELCSRYGQHERTLLSFLSDPGKHTVSTFIEENSWNKKKDPPVLGIDRLYDHFISGTNMIHSSSINISRLMEIETIIRDAHGLDKTETRTLKAIGILNLLGRSGSLRASKKLLDYATGMNTAQVLKKLESRSIITYRNYADEYRIWHGTDVDIAAELDMSRKRYKNALLSDMLRKAIKIESVVAAKHSIETGTMRIFQRYFMSKPHITLDGSYDGVIVYATDAPIRPKCDKPVITVTAKNTSDLRQETIEVVAIRDILANSEKVGSDWVAKKELEERLADAEIRLGREFNRAYGSSAKWLYLKDPKPKEYHGTPSAIASKVCDDAYPLTPRIHNEMINRTMLSSQGSAAKRNLLGVMITNTDKLRLGIEGYGPDRAVYEAVLFKNGIHIQDENYGWIMTDPSNEEIRPAWDAILGLISASKRRVPLQEIYKVCKAPPFGIKDGVILILVVAVFLAHKGNMALYEHGTFTPRILPEIAERMVKNPENYELKYFESTPSRKALLDAVAAEMNLNPNVSTLSIVGHVARTVSALHPHVKKTKMLDKKTLAMRDAVLNATEPDTLLFESLPKALGFKPFGTRIPKQDIPKFSKILAQTLGTLQKEFGSILLGMAQRLFDSTGAETREKLSKSASEMLQSISDQKMKVFLNAVSTDALESDEDWIKYVAMSLTEIPPDQWTDDQRVMFENGLEGISKKFSRLASVHFSKISDNYAKPSFQVTVTAPDGNEHYNIVSLKSEQKEKLKTMASSIMDDMKKKGYTTKDIRALVAMLILESDK